MPIGGGRRRSDQTGEGSFLVFNTELADLLWSGRQPGLVKTVHCWQIPDKNEILIIFSLIREKIRVAGLVSLLSDVHQSVLCFLWSQLES